MSKRGISRVSTRVRLAVAAAVLAGAGAAGVVAVSASHSGLATAQSAGYYQGNGRTMSYTSAMSSAMNGWDQSQDTSLWTIAHMKPVVNYWTQPWHRHVIFIQRGTVVAVGKHQIVVRSANGTLKVWQVNNGTTTLNVGGSSRGMSAMTGGTTKVPSWWDMDTRVKGLAKGDLVFVFGELERHTLKAQLVLFAAPMRTTHFATPANPADTAAPQTTVPAVAPSGVNGANFGTHS